MGDDIPLAALDRSYLGGFLAATLSGSVRGILDLL